MIWKVLGIEKTKDEEAIKAAYRNKLRDVNPEDDAEGFKELRRAYEEAVEYANEEESGLHNVEDDESDSFAMPKNEIDLWIDKVDAVYQDAKTRKDESKWQELLKDSVCEGLDTELEAAEKLLVYFMSHSFMPQNIWQLVDKRFGYRDNYNQWKEKFPENFLSYVKWQIEHSNFIDFELFDGKTNEQVDEYIGTLYEEKSAFEAGDMKAVKRLLEELDSFSVKHPFTKLEEARYLLKKESTEDTNFKKEALEIMEELDFEYSENPYIERIYAETLMENENFDKAMSIFESLLEEAPDNYGALLGRAKCKFLQGNAEEAKEEVEDILENRVQDPESLEMLDTINEKLMKDYKEILSKGENREVTFKLGWCYYQCKDFEAGIKLLDEMEESEDYDYVNLRCRLYLANEEYEKALPFAKKWLEIIEASEDDGSREMTKRKNRLSLAHFSIGVSMWEIAYRNRKEKSPKSQMEEGEEYIKKAIVEETNPFVRFSYMEQLAKFHLENKKYEECIAICTEIIEEDDGFFPAYVHRQKANFELKNAKEVIDDFFECKEIYPKYSRPYILAAEVFMAFEQYDDVENVLAAGEEAELDSDGLELCRIKCLHYKEFSKENVKKAIEELLTLRTKIKGYEDDKQTDIEDMADLEKELAILYWDQDNIDMTLRVINDYLNEHPDSITMLHLKADVMNREKRYNEALEVCEDLVLLEPNSLFSKMKLGGCYERMDENQKAIECYEKILKEDNKYVPAVRRMMYVYSYLSNRENDLELCELGIEYATILIDLTGSAEGYVERGNLYIDIYELEKSVADCKKAIELDPDAYYAYNNLGCALLKLRRVEEAIEPLKQAIEIDPVKDTLPYMNLAECYVLLGQYDEAILAYKEVLKIRENTFSVNDEIAKIYIKKKEYEKALAIYQKRLSEVEKEIKKFSIFARNATANDVSYLALNCKIGDVYVKSGDTKKAEKYFSCAYNYCHKVVGIKALAKLERVAEFYRDIDDLNKAKMVMIRALYSATKEEKSTTDYAHLCFTAANIYAQLGEHKEAKKYADIFLDDLYRKNDGEEKLLSAKRYRPINLYLIGIIKICKGELSEGKKYIEQIKGCNLCVHCENAECHEYHFGMGLIAELEGRIEDAKVFYEKAISIKGGCYPAAERRLRNL